MKANTSPAISAADFDALVAALDKVATFAPPGFPNWVSIAKDGADAARVQNLDAVKAACRGCHNQYRAKYKQEMRDRPI
jgi:cytochrome c556